MLGQASVVTEILVALRVIQALPEILVPHQAHLPELGRVALEETAALAVIKVLVLGQEPVAVMQQCFMEAQEIRHVARKLMDPVVVVAPGKAVVFLETPDRVDTILAVQELAAPEETPALAELAVAQAAASLPLETLATLAILPVTAVAVAVEQVLPPLVLVVAVAAGKAGPAILVVQAILAARRQQQRTTLNPLFLEVLIQ